MNFQVQLFEGTSAVQIIMGDNTQVSGGTFTEANLQTVAAKFVRDGLVAPSARGLYLVITAPGVSDATRCRRGAEPRHQERDQ